MKSEIKKVLRGPFENQNTRLRCYKKGHIIQHKGDENSKLYFIKQGLVRSYDIDEGGKLHIFAFATSGSSIYDPKSITTNQPSELFLDVLEDSIIEIINLNALDFSVISPKSKDLIISILNTCVCDMQSRIIKMMSVPTFERYKFFIKSQ
ncbi:MAG: cyclic nucleotide-binding domain-containing protein, partial [Bacteroidota bacterium]